MREVVITIYASRSILGQEFIAKFESMVIPFMTNELNLKVILNGLYADVAFGDMVKSGLGSDLVIFDASIEEGFHDNYKVANMLPMTLSHFLVISRTRLPINFIPFHEGGTPETSGVNFQSPFLLTNNEIIQWLLTIIPKLSPALPRPEKDKFNLIDGQIANNRSTILALIKRLVLESSDQKQVNMNKRGQAFISYLSKYSKFHRQPQAVEGKFVEDLIEYIKLFHKDKDYPILYYPPGTLASEFMTEHRRWQIMSIVDRRIRAADEFWVFETEDYYDSWWTLSELMSIAYMRASNNHALIIYRCQVANGDFKVSVVDDSYIQTLDKKIAREIGRFMSNSDPLTGGYETVQKAMRMRNQPWLLRRLNHLFTKMVMDYVFSDFYEFEEMKNTQDNDYNPLKKFADYDDMLHSHVYSNSFWTDRYVACPNCTHRNSLKNKFNTKDFIYHKIPGIYKINNEQTDFAIKKGEWVCQICGHKYYVIEDLRSQYRWWPMRMAKSTGPNGVFLEKIPVYSLSNTLNKN